MDFTKYEAAGNTYIIANKDDFKLTSQHATTCCDAIYGIGGDGVITWKTSKKNQETESVHVDIFNPDGSLAEKSGNGLRILATFLFDHVFLDVDSLSLQTLGGEVTATRTHNKNRQKDQVLLEMGTVVSQFSLEPLANCSIFPNGIQVETAVGQLTGYPVSIGNPHFVIFDEALSAEKAQKYGPHIENHSLFPNRTNVQFAKVIDSENISAEIWERGAGYTLSSGSSSCAIAAVAYQLGFCKSQITVSMPGGRLSIELAESGAIWLKGPVNKTVEGVFYIQ
ncbi:MAG: diaminopimelate epimerase [Candidatus Promineifilaceae bacterium]|jgi:diaminopimelate epimerase